MPVQNKSVVARVKVPLNQCFQKIATKVWALTVRNFAGIFFSVVYTRLSNAAPKYSNCYQKINITGQR